MIPMRERERERERDKIKEKHSLMSDCASMVPLMLHIKKKKKMTKLEEQKTEIQREKNQQGRRKETVSMWGQFCRLGR